MDLTSVFLQMIAQKSDQNNSVLNKANNVSTASSSTSSKFKLRDLVVYVTHMRNYLISSKKDYINIYNSILSMASTMTDEERDQIDADVHQFVKLSNDIIKILKVEIKSRKSPQQFEHESNAIMLVENYIKSVHEFHNKQKALRLRRNLDSQIFFRLSKSISKGDSSGGGGGTGHTKVDQSERESEQTERNPSGSTKSKDKQQQQKLHTLTVEDLNESNELKADELAHDYGLSPEQVKLLQEEGSRIYQEMNSMNDEVKNIGKKLSEIAKLQEAFSENVLKQEMDLNNLNSTTITSTETIREGNEQLREAMRKNAGFRVWILFFITTLAFVVLFLDWYNG